MRHRTNEGENVGADEHTRRCKNLIGDGLLASVTVEGNVLVPDDAPLSRAVKLPASVSG